MIPLFRPEENQRRIVVGDAYAGHNILFADGNRTPVACWVHARRNFYELIAKEPDALAMVRLIAVLYTIEERPRHAHADHDTVLATWQREAVPQLARIRADLNRLALATTPKCPLGKAANYALTCWDALTRYTNTG